MSCIFLFFAFVSQQRIRFYRLSSSSYISKRISRKRRSLVEYRYLAMDVLQITNEKEIPYITYCYRLSCVQSKFFPCRLRMSVSRAEAGMNMPAVSRFHILLRYAGHTNPRAGHKAGPPRLRSRQVGTVAEEANETVYLVPIKGPRNANTRNPSPAARRFWVSYVYLYLCTRYSRYCQYTAVYITKRGALLYMLAVVGCCFLQKESADCYHFVLTASMVIFMHWLHAAFFQATSFGQ